MKKIYTLVFNSLPLFIALFFTTNGLLGQACPIVEINSVSGPTCTGCPGSGNCTYNYSFTVLNPTAGNKCLHYYFVGSNGTIYGETQYSFFGTKDQSFPKSGSFTAPCNITFSSSGQYGALSWSGFTGQNCNGTSCAGNEGSLPISLVSFTGEAEQKFVKLEWQTAQEVNNEMFKIVKSTDGTNWRVIGQLNGAINSNTLIDYQFVDKSPVNGNNYYRLVQQDLDGQSTNSQIIQVDFNSPAWEPLVTINAVTKSLQVFTKTVEGKATLRIYNLNGQILLDQRIQDGSLQSLSDLPAGSYLCQLIDQKNVFVKKFVLSH